MDGDVFRLQINEPSHAFQQSHFVIPGKTGDQVHVDLKIPHLPGHAVAFLDLLHRVKPSHILKHSIVHTLGIDADASHAVTVEHLQLFSGDGLRPSGLHGEFPGMGQMLLNRRQQTIHLWGRQSGGSAASHIDAVQLPAVLPEALPGRFHFTTQSIQIGRDQMAPLGSAAADKGAIDAFAGAEGNADIKGPRLFRQTAFQLLGLLGAADGQLPPGWSDEKPLFQKFVCFFFLDPLGKGLAQRLGRLDAAHGAPHRRLWQKAHHRPIDGGFHRPGLHPLLLQRAVPFRRQTAFSRSFFAAPHSLYPAKEVSPLPRERDGDRSPLSTVFHKAVALFGKQTDQSFMHRRLQSGAL